MTDLGEEIRMEHSTFKIQRKDSPVGYPYEWNPAYGVNTQTKVVTYYNTRNRPLKEQQEIESKFAYTIWTEYKRW